MFRPFLLIQVFILLGGIIPLWLQAVMRLKIDTPPPSLRWIQNVIMQVWLACEAMFGRQSSARLDACQLDLSLIAQFDMALGSIWIIIVFSLT